MDKTKIKYVKDYVQPDREIRIKGKNKAWHVTRMRELHEHYLKLANEMEQLAIEVFIKQETVLSIVCEFRRGTVKAHRLFGLECDTLKVSVEVDTWFKEQKLLEQIAYN